MLERKGKSAFKVLRPVAETLAAGFVAGLLGGASVTLGAHRRYTHRSISLHPVLENFFDLEQRTVTVNPRLWAGVHRIHHQMPDVALAPFSRISNGIKWIQENPDQTKGVEIPTTYPHLDPFVDRFTLDEVMEIGNLTTDFFREKLGDKYQPPESYTKAELDHLLNPRQPMYLYQTESHGGDYTLADMEDILGGDPHSPVRFSNSNGIRAELFHIPKVNKGAAGLLKEHPELLSEDLRGKDGQNRAYGKLDMALGFAIMSGLVLVIRGKYTPKDFLIAALQGSAINGIKIGLQLIGGNTVNSLGHAGSITEGQMMTAIKNQDYKIQVNPDGTVSTDTRRSGLVGKLLGGFTFDEVGGQKEHHEDPANPAYTSEKGLKAWREAPWGSFISFLSESKWFPLINPGPGFDLKEGQTRPDEPHPAVAIIHRIRAEQLAQKRY